MQKPAISCNVGPGPLSGMDKAVICRHFQSSHACVGVRLSVCLSGKDLYRYPIIRFPLAPPGVTLLPCLSGRREPIGVGLSECLSERLALLIVAD